MISSFKPGYRKDVSVGEFKVTLVQRRVNGMQSHARRVAAKIVKVVNLSGEVDDLILGDLAKMYGVHKALIGDCVRQCQVLLSMRP
jgi:hypothetical protein